MKCFFKHQWQYFSRTWNTTVPGDDVKMNVTLDFRECTRCGKLQSAKHWFKGPIWRNETRRELLTCENIQLKELGSFSISK
jgi:hypothetical protein